MMTPYFDEKILLVGKNVSSIKRALVKRNVKCHYCETGGGALDIMRRQDVDVVFIGEKLDDVMSSHETVMGMLHLKPNVPVVLVSSEYLIDREKMDNYYVWFEEDFYSCILSQMPNRTEDVLNVTREVLDLVTAKED